MALLLTVLLTQVAYADTAAKCVSGDCVNGQGTFIYGDGTKYVGEWKNNKKDGQGTMISSDGSVYVGEWKHGIQEGQGTITGQGHKYVGEFKDGQGTMTMPDGKVQTGIWKNDQYIGQ
jgi:hypothetical protein